MAIQIKNEKTKEMIKQWTEITLRVKRSLIERLNLVSLGCNWRRRQAGGLTAARAAFSLAGPASLDRLRSGINLTGIKSTQRNFGAVMFPTRLVWLVVFPGILAAQAPAVRISPNLRILPGQHNEPWVAVSSVNPDILIAAAQQDETVSLPKNMGVSVVISRDGGRIWTPLSLPSWPAATPFDVMVAAGPDGRLYVMTGVIGGPFWAQTTKDAPPKSSIRFWSSTDNGFTWDSPTDLASSVDPDHPRMTVDLSAAKTHGRIYVAWNDWLDEFVRDQYEVFLQWSDDQGKTFTNPKLIGTGTDGKLVATEPVVLSDGTVLVTYYQYFNPIVRRDNQRMPMFVARSTNGGRMFSAPEKIFEFGPHIWRERVTEFSRAFSLPIVTADTSPKSPYQDRIYLTWDDVSGGASNIWFVSSTDKSRTWSKPIRLNDNPPGPATGVKDYRMTPVVAVNAAGTVMVAWYDRRNDPNRMCWEYFAALSTDGGATFGPNFKISSAPSCPPPGYPPSVAVHNVSPRIPDPNRLPDSLLERLSLPERIQILNPRENEAARDEANRGLSSPRLTISFDPARNLWPGHYTGLAADRDGTFHAVWLDRRGGTQELYTARIVLGPAERPAELVETDISNRIEVMAGPPTFDPAKNTVTMALQVRNVGSSTVFGPIQVAIKGIGATAAFDTTVTLAGKLGTADRLLPRDLSEPVLVTFQVKPEAGFDAAFDFRVTGSAPRGQVRGLSATNVSFR